MSFNCTNPTVSPSCSLFKDHSFQPDLVLGHVCEQKGWSPLLKKTSLSLRQLQKDSMSEPGAPRSMVIALGQDMFLCTCFAKIVHARSEIHYKPSRLPCFFRLTICANHLKLLTVFDLVKNRERKHWS